MPFKSKAQMRKFFAMERRGEMPMAKVMDWVHKTPNIKKLPDRKGRGTIAQELIRQRSRSK